MKTVLKAFIENLNSVEWMDKKTRALALEKAYGMHIHIAYPNELLDDSKLKEYYDGLIIRPGSLLDNVMQIRKFMRHRKIIQFREAINKTDWQTHSRVTAVNAYNSLMENSIRTFFYHRFIRSPIGFSNGHYLFIIRSYWFFCGIVELPAAVLQNPFFADDRWAFAFLTFRKYQSKSKIYHKCSIRRPSYLNYGAIGWFISHEIIHSAFMFELFSEPNDDFFNLAFCRLWWHRTPIRFEWKFKKLVAERNNNQFSIKSSMFRWTGMSMSSTWWPNMKGEYTKKLKHNKFYCHFIWLVFEIQRSYFKFWGEFWSNLGFMVLRGG